MGGKIATWLDGGPSPYPARVKAAKLLAGLALVMAGCASAPTTAPSSGSAAPSPAVSGARPITRLTVALTMFGSRQQLQRVTDGVRTRTIYVDAKGVEDRQLFNASDGTTQVSCDSAGCGRSPAEPVAIPGTPAFEQQCARAEKTGTGELLGRRTTTWKCAGNGMKFIDITLDAEYPDVILKGSSENDAVTWEATAFESGITVPADFFAIDRPGLTFPPATRKPVNPPKAGKAGSVLPKLGGGELRMTDYTNGPAVIVIGEESQVRPALARMRRVAEGELPALVAVLQFHDVPGAGTPSEPFDVPVALNAENGKVWQDLTASGTWPVALFCPAAATTCTAISVWELADDELAAELAKVT